MLGLDYAEQLKQKEAAVRKLVGKYGPVAPIRGAENPCHYRNKVISTFAAGPGGKLVSGIYAAGTHKVLPVESCLLQDEVLDTVMQAVRAAASACRYQPYNEDKGIGLLRHCLLRRGVVSGQVMVVLVTAQPVLPGAKNLVRALLAEAGIVIDAYSQDAPFERKQLVSCRMVRRQLDAGPGGQGTAMYPMGATQASASALGYQQSWTVSGGSVGELYLSKLEKRLLGVGDKIGAHSPLEDMTC